jgi:hypothetical protein
MPEDRWGPVDVEVVALDSGAEERPSRRRSSGHGLAALALLGAAAVLAVVVLAVTRGGDHRAPASYPPGTAVAADARYGATVPGSVRLLADDVADPDGGPRWGLRAFGTTRGYGCLQVGRVQDGALGVLALAAPGGGSLQAGRFHALPSAPAAQATTCVPQDGGGAAFVATHVLLTTAATPASCWYASAGATGLRCAAATTRTVDAGLLGPRARAVTAWVDGRRRRLPTRGRAGAYLVVQRPVRPSTVRQRLAGRTYVLPNEAPLAQTPASNVIAAVAYAGAPPCHAHPTLSPRGSCAPAVGFTPVTQPLPGAARAPVTVTPAAGRDGAIVRFVAPLAARDGRSDYRVVIDGPPHLDGDLPLATDVAAGVRVTRRLALPPGRYRIEVRYRILAPFPRPSGGPSSPGYPVGRGTVEVRPLAQIRSPL